MNALSNLFLLADDSGSWLPLLIVAAIKGALIVALAGLITFCLRKASAAVRHLIWCGALASLLLLPLLSWLLPRWPIAILPASSVIESSKPLRIANRFSSAFSPSVFLLPEMTWAVAENNAIPRQTREPLERSFAAPARSSTSRGPLSPAGWFLLSWWIGFVAMLGWLLLSAWGVRRLRASAQSLTEPRWTSLLGHTLGQLHLRRPLRFLQSGKAIMPMTWGALRPVLLLPTRADAWPEQRRRLVLLHELAHIKRWDYLTQMVGAIACALYWFHPLVWMAARRMRVERERACDDLVLEAGEKASEYAGQLLEIARDFRALPWASAAAIAMAKPSELEGRLLAILDAKRNRRPLGAGNLMVVLAGLMIVAAPLAALRAGPKAEKDRPSAPVPRVARDQRNQARIRPAAQASAAAVRAKAIELFDKLPSAAFADWDNWLIANEILKLGPEAIPALVEELETASHADQQNGPGRPLSAPDQKAALLIAEFGPLAKPAVPELIRLLGSTHGRTQGFVIMALGEIGPAAKEAAPALLELLKQGNDAVPHVLCQIDPGSPLVLKTLVEVLQFDTTRSPHVRSAAAWAIGSFGPRAREAVPALARALSSTEPRLCVAAAESLAKIGSPEALDALRGALRHPNSHVRISAGIALLKMPETRRQAKAVLIESLQDHENINRARVVAVLCDLGPDAAEAVPAIVELLKQGKLYSPSSVAESLGKMGPAAKSAVPVLRELLNDQRPLTRLAAAFALAKIDGEIEMAARIYEAALSDPNLDVRAHAAFGLAELGEPAKPVVQKLKHLLEERNSYPRWTAAKAIWKLDHQPAEVVPALIDIVQDNIHCGKAIEILGEIGPEAKAAVPVLKLALQSKRAGQTAAEALARIDPEHFGKRKQP